MKICSFSPIANFYRGGGEVYSLYQAKHLASLVDKIDLAVLKVPQEKPEFLDFISETDINVQHLNSPALEKKAFHESNMTDWDNVYDFYRYLSRPFADLCMQENYDVVITHVTLANFCIPSSIRVCSILHGLPSTIDDINRAAVRNADTLLAVSESIRNGWLDDSKGELHIELLPNGVDQHKFFPISNAVEDIDIFYVGRLIEIKGVQYLIDAVHLLQRNGKNLHVVIGGTGPYKEELELLVNKLGLQQSITFIGFVSDDELNNYYNRSKMCVFPSYAKEGVLTTMLEAAAAERPIITSNCCGMVDFMIHKENGLLAEPANATSLADNIQLYLDNEVFRKNMGINARKSVLESWTWEKSAQRILSYI